MNQDDASSPTGAAPSRLHRAWRGASTGLAAGAVLGLLDALRCRMDAASVLPPSLSPVVVLLYAAAMVAPSAVAGALLPSAVAAAGIVGVALALGVGLAANYWFLPAFLDARSLTWDGVILVVAALVAIGVHRVFRRRGAPVARSGWAVLGVCLLLATAMLIGGGRDDGPGPMVLATGGDGAKPATRPPVLLLVVDTLRADAPGFSGAAGSAKTPHLDALAAEGAVFTRCRAPSSWTKPATASLLTGRYPTEHGALGFESILPGGAVTLGELFRAGGWRTAAFADNPFISKDFGFGQGFQSFRGRAPSPLARGTLLLRAVTQVRAALAGGEAFAFGPGYEIGAPTLLADAVRFLARRDAENPGFAYVHLIEPHHPYTPPAPRDGLRRVDPPHASGILPFDRFPALPEDDRAAMKAAYLGEVETVDDAIGAAVEALRAAGLLDKVLLVVTSDHGEEFHEHGGWTHGQSLYEELVRVPLLVRAPKGMFPPGLRIDAEVNLVDIAPTLLELTASATDTPFSGRSLVPLLRGEKLPPRLTVAEIEAGPVGARSIHIDGRVFIHARKGSDEVTELFDLQTDPEQHNATKGFEGSPPWPEGDPAVLLRQLFEALQERALQREHRPFDPDTADALEHIGYLGGK